MIRESLVPRSLLNMEFALRLEAMASRLEAGEPKAAKNGPSLEATDRRIFK